MKPLFDKPEPLQAENQKAARVALAKLIGKWALYLIGLIAFGVAMILWFMVAVLLQPFRGDGVND